MEGPNLHHLLGLNRKAALEALFKTLLHHLMTARRRLPPEFISRFE